jgi:hypothetical protein
MQLVREARNGNAGLNLQPGYHSHCLGSDYTIRCADVVSSWKQKLLNDYYLSAR